MSPAAVRESALRHQRHAEAHHGAQITIGSTSAKAAAILGPVRHAPQEDGSGWEKVQTLTVTVLKSTLRTMPAKRTAITYNGVDYLITTIGGQTDQEPAWRIEAQRRSPASA